MSIEQENIQATDRVAVYEAEGSAISHILFYHAMMENAGWHADDSFTAAMRKEKHNNIMYYEKNKRECTIFIEEDEQNGKILTTVMDREYKNDKENALLKKSETA